MDISMGIRPQYDPLSHAPRIKAIREIYQTNPAQLSPELPSDQARTYQEAYHENSNPSAQKHEAKVLAKYVMQKPVITIDSHTSPENAKNLIKQYHYHHFPVVDSQEKIIGLLSDRDLLRNSPNRDHRLSESEEPTQNGDISSLMSTKLVVAYANTPLSEIGKAMLTENIKCVPIVDQDHRVIGMTTSTDFIRCVIKHHEVNEQS